MQGEDAEVVAAVRAGNLEHPGIDPAMKELLSFCGNVTRHAYKTSPEMVEKLRGLGWSDEQVAEAVFVTAMFAFFNRVADAFGLEDPGFLEMAAEGQPAPKPAEGFQPPESP